jgi:sialidase-1
MAKISVLKTGLIYRNPKPHVHSVHAYFPSVVTMANGEMLASLVLAEAFEAADMRTHLCRSTDGGETWEHQGLLPAGTSDAMISNASRLTSTPEGEVVAYTVRMDRSEHSEDGLTNPTTLGFVPTTLTVLRSADFGRTWSSPSIILPPLVGPCFELCSPITVLRDGRWVIPTLTWPDWEGRCPNGVKMIAMLSPDRGRSWPAYWDVMQANEGRVFFWESKITELPDGQLLAVAWTYDDLAGKDRPNHYALSTDGGNTWSAPASTGLIGQTLTPLALDDGRILSVYRRMDTPGLWANLSRLRAGVWENEASEPIWGNQVGGLTATTRDMAHNFNVLRFGAPSLVKLPDATVFVAFWCYEDCVSVIRWYTLAVG